MPMSTDPFTRITKALKDRDFEHFHWAPLQTPLSFNFYTSWLQDQHHGDMKYLQTSHGIKENPKAHFAPMQTLISVAEPYFPRQEKNGSLPLKNLKVAHYAQQEDYHFWLRSRLQAVCDTLKKSYPDEEFLAFTDAVPLLERDHAYQAGLGWIGKNTCLIDRKRGSLFFIGEILTTLSATNPAETIQDFCGTCTKCMDACPTGALDTARVLEAKKCISYWNIEAKENPPEALRPKMQDWLFGCDICQTVCPWNMKIHKGIEGFSQESSPDTEKVIQELRWILASSNKKLMKALAKTPLTRAGGRGLKRNALIVAANKNLKELIPEIKMHIENPQIGEVAQWALKTLAE